MAEKYENINQYLMGKKYKDLADSEIAFTVLKIVDALENYEAVETSFVRIHDAIAELDKFLGTKVTPHKN